MRSCIVAATGGKAWMRWWVEVSRMSELRWYNFVGSEEWESSFVGKVAMSRVVGVRST